MHSDVGPQWPVRVRLGLSSGIAAHPTLVLHGQSADSSQRTIRVSEGWFAYNEFIINPPIYMPFYCCRRNRYGQHNQTKKG
jgi:hypothetical protein